MKIMTAVINSLAAKEFIGYDSFGEKVEIRITPRYETTLKLDFFFWQNLPQVEEYDLNGDRDAICFNITEYDDKESDRDGSKIDGARLKETLSRKGFRFKAFRDGKLRKEDILDELNNYVEAIGNERREVKILVIAFMAHGTEDDYIGG